MTTLFKFLRVLLFWPIMIVNRQKDPVIPSDDELYYIDEDCNLRVNHNSTHFKESFKKNIKALQRINTKYKDP